MSRPATIDEPLPWWWVMRRLDRLAVDAGLLDYAPSVDDRGRPLSCDRGAVLQARQAVLAAWDREHPGEPLVPCAEDMDRLTAWWRARTG